RFPAALEDCYAAAREGFLHPEWVFAERAEDIALIGDSAGGNLAAAVSLMAKDRGEFMPTRQILIYPATYNDHTENSPFPSVRENGSDYLLTSKRVQEF
ncbi:alpha/beta hydrolase fold domain-containing protein, partial [Bittarella massiliensis (ex Durand et al. 2017)]